MRSQRPVALTAVVIAALASWTWSRRVPNEQAMIEAEVANGWTLRNDAVPSTLAEAERSAFALVPDATYLKPDVPPEEWYADWRGVVPGGAAWDAGGHVRSPWAVWTTRALLSAKECAAMSKASRGLGLLGPPEALFSAFDNVSQAYITHRLYLFSFGQPWTISRLGRAATPFLALLPDKVRRVGRASRGAAARDRRLCVCWRQLGPLANPHGRPAAQRDAYGYGRGLRSPHEDEAGRSGLLS